MIGKTLFPSPIPCSVPTSQIQFNSNPLPHKLGFFFTFDYLDFSCSIAQHPSCLLPQGLKATGS